MSVTMGRCYKVICITFSLDDPEGTRKIEKINDEAESLDVWCEFLLEGFEKWAAEQEAAG
jgi:hypothetical protein